MPSRTLIAAAIGLPLLIGGTVLVVKAASSSGEPAATPAAAATAVEKKPAVASPPRMPSATLPAPKLPPLDPELRPKPVPPPTATPTTGDEAPKAADAKAGDSDAERREIARQHGRNVPDFARTNPGVQDSATQAEVAAKTEIIRKRTLIDKFACNAPESKERMELLPPEERAKWEKRCKRTNGTAPAATR